MFSSQTKDPLFVALFMSVCTVVGHTHVPAHTHKHTQSQPSCRRSDLDAHTDSGFTPLFSRLSMPPPPFHETTQDPSEPRGERAKFTRGTLGISGAVVYWWTAPLWLGTRGQGMTPEARCVLWCLCVCLCVCACMGLCVCWHLYVFQPQGVWSSVC